MFKHKNQPIQTYHCQKKNKAREQGPFLGEKHDVLRSADVSQNMFLKWDLVPRWEQKSQPVVFTIYRGSNILRSHMEARDVKLGHCLLQLHLHHIEGCMMVENKIQGQQTPF